MQGQADGSLHACSAGSQWHTSSSKSGARATARRRRPARSEPLHVMLSQRDAVHSCEPCEFAPAQISTRCAPAVAAPACSIAVDGRPRALAGEAREDGGAHATPTRRTPSAPGRAPGARHVRRDYSVRPQMRSPVEAWNTTIARGCKACLRSGHLRGVLLPRAPLAACRCRPSSPRHAAPAPLRAASACSPSRRPMSHPCCTLQLLALQPIAAQLSCCTLDAWPSAGAEEAALRPASRQQPQASHAERSGTRQRADPLLFTLG
jgi:hypothetical protein